MKLLLISMFLIILIVNSTNPLNDPLNSQSSIQAKCNIIEVQPALLCASLRAAQIMLKICCWE